MTGVIDISEPGRAGLFTARKNYSGEKGRATCDQVCRALTVPTPVVKGVGLVWVPSRGPDHPLHVGHMCTQEACAARLADPLDQEKPVCLWFGSWGWPGMTKLLIGGERQSLFREKDGVQARVLQKRMLRGGRVGETMKE